MIFGIIDFFYSSLTSSCPLSYSALYGIIYPGTLASIHSLIFFNHLFFLATKSSKDKLIRYTTDFAVINLWVFKTSISVAFHYPCLTHLFWSSKILTLSRISFYYLAYLLLFLLICLSKSSILLSTYYRSLRMSSVLIIYISLMGSTEF